MENSEKQMTPEESLKLIGEVISSTRSNLKADSFFFLLWGWLIALAAIGESAILWNAGRLQDWKNVGLFSGLNWGGLVLIGIVIQIFYVRKHYVKRPYSNFFEKVIAYLWILSAAIIFLLIYISGVRHLTPEPFILATVSIPTVVTGLITRFKPLIIGGLLFILFAILAVNLDQDWIRSLTSAFAMITGYLIPGYMLRSKN